MDGDIGDLMVLPKSQYSMWDPSALGQIFKDTPLPGGKVFDDMPNGTAVICHSGLVHGRRQKPGGEDHPRYFVDVSYCQPGDFVTNNRMGRKQVRVSTHFSASCLLSGSVLRLFRADSGWGTGGAGARHGEKPAP